MSRKTTRSSSYSGPVGLLVSIGSLLKQDTRRTSRTIRKPFSSRTSQKIHGVASSALSVATPVREAVFAVSAWSCAGFSMSGSVKLAADDDDDAEVARVENEKQLNFMEVQWSVRLA